MISSFIVDCEEDEIDDGVLVGGKGVKWSVIVLVLN